MFKQNLTSALHSKKLTPSSVIEYNGFHTIYIPLPSYLSFRIVYIIYALNLEEYQTRFNLIVQTNTKQRSKTTLKYLDKR